MTTEARAAPRAGAPVADAPPRRPERVLSIDAFRGWTILVMFFVNDVSGVRGIPAWMRHAPPGGGMTFVDVVLPAFLFIVGLAIPFALSRRLDRGEPLRRIVGHIALRTFGLLVLGVFMVNMPPDQAATPIGAQLWMLLVFVCAILVWNVYPPSRGLRRAGFLALRALGIAGLIALAAIYRGDDHGQIVWLRPQWWGILGLIGWAYLVGCGAYLVFHRRIEAMVGMIGVLILAFIAADKGVFEPLEPVAGWLSIGSTLGSQASITVAGVTIGLLFFPGSPATTPAERVRWIAVFALLLFVAGWWLSPLYGIAKDDATPSWCLFCTAICSVLFAVLYLVIDVWGRQRWTRFVDPAGQNPLLGYFLPYLFYAALGLWPNQQWATNPLASPAWSGVPGIVRSMVFALAMVWLTGLLGRAHVRLRF